MWTQIQKISKSIANTYISKLARFGFLESRGGDFMFSRLKGVVLNHPDKSVKQERFPHVKTLFSLYFLEMYYF